jgi:hypothetical protein
MMCHHFALYKLALMSTTSVNWLVTITPQIIQYEIKSGVAELGKKDEGKRLQMLSVRGGHEDIEIQVG